MCAADARESAPAEPGARRDYGTIVVVGGGCYGSYYVRQLTRARDAGALRYERIVVVDRDPHCRVARATGEARAAVGAGPGGAPRPGDRGAPPRHHDAPEREIEHHHFDAIAMECAEWGDFFERYLEEAAERPGEHARDAIVPSPLMPHLMYEWLLSRTRRRWPGREVRTVPLDTAPPTPWQRAAPDGTHYVSFAEWTCPINCVEPRLCPVTRGPRDWTMPAAVRGYVEAERARGGTLAGPLVFHCTHRAYGVGMFDTSAVVEADREVARLAADRAARVLVGTVSHCHGALCAMDVAAPA